MNKLLLLDDDRHFLGMYSKILRKAGFDVLTETDGHRALELMKESRPDLIISDMVMPEMDGLTFLRAARTQDPKAVIIILTGEGSISGAVEAMKEGAYSYLAKPVNIDELLLLAQRAAQYRNLADENIQLKNRLGWDVPLDALIGSSALIQAVRSQLAVAAASDASVLITGESGTGKELAAVSLHQMSRRAKGPLIKVNCGAMTESLLESELFGHEKGAFTGATAQKPGRFERADGGTLFLDEISEASPAIQAKLLRVLQEKEFERVGGTRTIPTDFRLVTATNRDLGQLIESGSFREDLFYRIHVIPVHMPALRQRREDIPMLLDHFLREFCRQMGKELQGFPPASLRALGAYDWPGNVRELRNYVERVVVFTPVGEAPAWMEPDPMGRPSGGKQPPEGEPHNTGMPEPDSAISLAEARKEFEARFLQAALDANSGNIAATARSVGIARNNLQKKLEELGLRKGATKK